MKDLIKKIISRLSGRIIYSSSPPSLYLTFDDGPSENIINILNVLEKYEVKATFFVLGKRLEGNTNMLDKIISGGHSIGNHSYSHESAKKQDFTSLSNDYSRNEKLIKNSLPNWQSHLLRPPYGDLSWPLFKYVFKNQKKIIMWTKDSIDYRAKSIEEFYKNLGECMPGDIILFHDENVLTVDFLDRFIPQMVEKGFSFCKL